MKCGILLLYLFCTLRMTNNTFYLFQLNAVEGDGTQTAGRFRIETGDLDGDDVRFYDTHNIIQL